MSTPPSFALALARTSAMHQAVLDDLDEIRGGISWWNGHLDQPTVIFASDYLVQIIDQAGRWLRQAEHHKAEFDQAWYAELSFMRRHADKGREPFAHRGELEARRAERIDAALVGFFHSCGSVFDSLAGSMLGVLGVRSDLVTASWTQLLGRLATPADQDKLLAPTDSDGRRIQMAAIDMIRAAAEAGPHGWLRWTLDTRNAMVHRAHRLELRRFYRQNPRSPLEFLLHLAKDPQLTDAEAFVIGQEPTDTVLWEHAGDTMQGVLDQTSSVTASAMTALLTAWQQRHASPTVIQQPPEQWKTVYPQRRDLAGFAGFGPKSPPAMRGEEVRVGPVAARRFKTARLLDEYQPFWVRELTKNEGT